MYVGEIEVQPPLKEWGAPKFRKAIERYAGCVALKRRGGPKWTGFVDAIEAEKAPEGGRFLWPGGYVTVTAEALPRIMERLGDNARRVTVRAITGECS